MYVRACIRIHVCIITWDEVISAKAQDLTLITCKKICNKGCVRSGAWSGGRWYETKFPSMAQNSLHIRTARALSRLPTEPTAKI